jgi:BMFP domain-containing protein YqiC
MSMSNAEAQRVRALEARIAALEARLAEIEVPAAPAKPKAK